MSMCCSSPSSSRLSKPAFAWSCGLWLEIGLIFGVMFKIYLKLFLGLGRSSSLCLIHRIELVLESFPPESPDWVFLLYPATHFHNKRLWDHLSLSQICLNLAKEISSFQEGTTREPYLSTPPGSATISPSENQPENHPCVSMGRKTCQEWQKKHSGYQRRSVWPWTIYCTGLF